MHTESITETMQEKRKGENNMYEFTPGVCTKCGNDDLLYHATHEVDLIRQELIYFYTCEKCNTEGKEVYSISFEENVEA